MDNILNILKDITEELKIIYHIYIVWNTPDKTFLSSIKKLFLFRKHICEKSLLSKEIIRKTLLFFDKICREKYIRKKYYVKWIQYFINKKSPVNTQDMELNDIDTSFFYINYIDYSTKRRYLFSLKDFKKIVENNLIKSYSYDIYPQPQILRNPYTNKEFTRMELCNINSIIGNFDMPIVWHMFVECDYNISKLKNKYYNYLYEKCIPSYVDQIDDTDLVYYLKQIFSYYDISYCKKCIRQKRNINSIKVKRIIIEWLYSIKFGIMMSIDCSDRLNNIYAKNKCYHRPKICVQRTPFIINLDFTKPLFCVGYSTIEDIFLYKEKIREKRILKLRRDIKIYLNANK